MDWVRLWHDMPNDPKWRLIARKSGCSIPEVISVYLHMLVNASESEPRGELTGWDDELVGIALDIDPDSVTAIRYAMEDRVINNDVLTGWDKRQPKRNDDSTDRVRKHRQKKKRDESGTCNDSEGVSEEESESENDNETPCNGDETQCNAQSRAEQSRPEEKKDRYDASGDASVRDPANESEPASEPEPKPDPEPPKHLTSQEFDDFWSRCRSRWFGKPGNRQEALTVYRKIRRDDIDPQRLTELALQDCRMRWAEHQRGQFADSMKHVCRWLRNRSWEDVTDQACNPSALPGDDEGGYGRYRDELKSAFAEAV